MLKKKLLIWWYKVYIKNSKICVFFKNFIFFAMVIFLAGCSVSPLYDDETRAHEPSKNIKVGVIAGREGQKLRGFLIDMFRDVSYGRNQYELQINLTRGEDTYAINEFGNATRVMFSYTASVMFSELVTRKVLLKRDFKVYNSYNISDQGDVILVIYGNLNVALLKELAGQISENVKIAISQNER